MISNSYLLGLYGVQADQAGFGTAAPTIRRKSQPTPPWDSSVQSKVPAQDSLVRAALGGRRVINEAATSLDLSGASDDYRKLFALYQGLNTLTALTNRAATKGVGASEQALLTKRFTAGLQEIGGYLDATRLEGLRLVQGTAASTSKSTAGVPRDSARSLTGPIHEGSPAAVVAAFEGDVAFSINVGRGTGTTATTTTVDIDLADLGSQPRTLDTVLNHINAKLTAAGLTTQIGREAIKAEPKVIQVGGKPVTLPAGQDRWALAIRGTSTETVSFTAATTADAVYLVQGAGTAGGHQLLKFQTDLGGSPPAATARIGETQWVAGRASQTGLPAGVDTVRASATGPDGSLWLVADVDAGPANQPIKGERDVALMKYDSAGRLVATRALGAASSASGYAIAIDAAGRVAVAGSVTGALEPGKIGDDAAVADSFVTVFDAEGQEVWTQRRGARAADEATSVTFGANGAVHVGGRSRSALPGAAGIGGWDGYLQTFTETQAHTFAPVIGNATATTQFGTTADDGVSAVAVDGSNLYSAGVENGRAVVRRFTLDAAGTPTLASTRDLGLISGEIAGIAVSGGRVIITGTTRNASLDAGTVNRAHAGGTDAFIATLSGDLQAAASDRLTYQGTAGDDTAADVKIHDGKVWITGVSNRPEGAKPTDPTEAYLTRLDPLTGAVEWSRTWKGDGNQAAPLTLAVASGGASVLDRLGLPKGTIDQSDSKLLTAATSLRVGDRFFVTPATGGRPTAVTIEARDTLQTLARKIEQASRLTLKVMVASEGGVVTGKDGNVAVTAGGFQRLSIMARENKAGAVLSAGEPGRDALAGLGLAAGFIGATTGDEALKTFGLDLPKTLSLSSADRIKVTGERLQAAMKAVRDAYRSLAPERAAPITGSAPAYLTTQLANYQAALSRLGG